MKIVTTPITTSQFLGQIWPAKLLSNETLELRLISRTDRSVSRKFFASPTDFLRAAQKYIQTHNVYFGVSTRFGHGGKKADCFRVRARWVDLDGKRKSDCDFDPVPDILVDSGGGIHAYWLYRVPIIVRYEEERQRKIEAINRSLADQFGGDINCGDITRILSVPGFLNY